MIKGSITINITLLLATLLCFACKQDDRPDTELFLPASTKNGSMQADKTAVDHNTVAWTAGGFARRDSFYYEDVNGTIIPYVPPRISLGSYTYDDFGQNREALHINYLPIGSGKYLLQRGLPDYGLPTAEYVRLVSDGDAIGAIYRTDIDKDNWVEITQIDTITKMVSGKFDIHLKIADNYLNTGFPVSIRFSNGVFNLKIVD